VRSAVHLAGALTPSEGEPARSFDLTFPSFEVTADIGLVIDRAAPATLAATLDWSIDGTLLDGVDPTDDDDALSAIVAENLALNPLIAVLEE
jgi:hypothetical protein